MEAKEAMATAKAPVNKPLQKQKQKEQQEQQEQPNSSFAAGLNGYKLVWIFAIACFLGVVIETIFVFLTTGKYMRRSGMLYGPFNQIYGLGAVLFTVALYRYRHKSKLAIFGASAMIGLMYEYICSFLQEKVLGSVSWEYSHMVGNLSGRINIWYGFFWGLLGLFFLSLFLPTVERGIESIPNAIGKPLTVGVALFLSVNLALSGLAVFRQKERILEIPPRTAIEQWLDNTYPDDRMREKYPSMDFVLFVLF